MSIRDVAETKGTLWLLANPMLLLAIGILGFIYMGQTVASLGNYAFSLYVIAISFTFGYIIDLKGGRLIQLAGIFTVFTYIITVYSRVQGSWICNSIGKLPFVGGFFCGTEAGFYFIGSDLGTVILPSFLIFGFYLYVASFFRQLVIGK